MEAEALGTDLVYFAAEIDQLFDPNLREELREKHGEEVLIRVDEKNRAKKDEVKDLLKEVFPRGIQNIIFSDFGVVLVELESNYFLANVELTKEILMKKTGWVFEFMETRGKLCQATRNVNKILYGERLEHLRKIGEKLREKGEAKWKRISFLGGCRQVGKSCFLFHTNSDGILLDCGIDASQSPPLLPAFDLPEFEIDKLHSIVVSHAHLDHCGAVPYLYENGFEGALICTRPSLDVMYLLWNDTLRLSKRNSKSLFSKKGIELSIKHAIPLEYERSVMASPNVKLTLYSAGHILGSSLIHLSLNDYKLLYTGDFSYRKTRLLDISRKKIHADTLIIESTYGGKEDLHPSRKGVESDFIKSVRQCMERGGSVLIPVAAVGRAQEIMLVLEEYMRSGALKRYPVYVDGMVREANLIYTHYSDFLRSSIRRRIDETKDNPFLSDIFHVITPKRRESIEEPAIILATSGMMKGGPVIHHLKRLHNDRRNLLILVGYQAQGTLGREILDGKKIIELNGEELKLDMEVKSYTFSAHSDRPQIMNFLNSLSKKPENIFVVHGEEENTLQLRKLIKNRLPDLHVEAPRELDSFRV
ncbi:MAG: MBL fold metallo-hydrolase RNA specificity domain-containing protein [Candidatus Hydrothermarchaeota archaeon]